MNHTWSRRALSALACQCYHLPISWPECLPHCVQCSPRQRGSRGSGGSPSDGRARRLDGGCASVSVLSIVPFLAMRGCVDREGSAAAVDHIINGGLAATAIGTFTGVAGCRRDEEAIPPEAASAAGQCSWIGLWQWAKG